VKERLDGDNGLLFTPNADHLFDRGFIGFDNNGDVLVSPVADVVSLVKMGVDPARRTNVGRFSTKRVRVEVVAAKIATSSAGPARSTPRTRA
jgi:hypothetical protein